MTTATPQNYSDPVVEISTSLGNIFVELYPAAAPITVNNFLTYAASGFYNGTIFHRVVAGFVDQGGGYTTQGVLKATSAPITLESNNGLSNLTGTIAMARTSDPNSATSQFYINAVNNSFLDYISAASPGYAVFGDTIQGLNVVEQINAVPVNANSVPLTNVVINSVTTELLYQGNRSDYVISLAGGQISVTPKSVSVPEAAQPSASVLSKIEQLQFADLLVTPFGDTVSNVVGLYQRGGLNGPSDVFDSSANVLTSLDTLQTLAAKGKLFAIGLTDSGIPSLSLTAIQASNDATALNDISGNFSVTQTTSGANQTIAGINAALGNTVSFSGNASQYSVTPAGDGVHFTLTGNGITDQISGVQALKFGDLTEIVAAAPSANSVTTGNITELYGAVFGREPDVTGLAYYLHFATSAPATPLLQYAEYFLASPEYANNSAHNYAQTVAGDQQFITDSYKNLLLRTPSAVETAFYENNVIAPALANLTPGSAAYAAAQTAAHAQLLVYFSASPEFLGDVQITATNPASTSHWLQLI